MPDDSVVDNWLDFWEALRGKGRAVSLDEFIRLHCGSAAPDLVAVFRTKVRDLGKMEACL